MPVHLLLNNIHTHQHLQRSGPHYLRFLWVIRHGETSSKSNPYFLLILVDCSSLSSQWRSLLCRPIIQWPHGFTFCTHHCLIFHVVLELENIYLCSISNNCASSWAAFSSMAHSVDRKKWLLTLEISSGLCWMHNDSWPAKLSTLAQLYEALHSPPQLFLQWKSKFWDLQRVYQDQCSDLHPFSFAKV